VSQIVSKPQYYVVDTNTIFDLYYGDLLEFVFRLPCTFIISDFIIHELREPPYHQLSTMGLCVEHLDSDGVSEITVLMAEYPKPSYADLSVLVLAKTKKTILITGDKDLRHAAISKGVDCYGTCWLINILAEESIITYTQAIDAYTYILEKLRHPPVEECRRHLTKWKQLKKILE